MIVDDEPQLADALCALVNTWGHQGRPAYDGASGLVIAADQRPEVILMDLAMPRMDGYELGQQLRCSPWMKCCFLIGLRAGGESRGWPQRNEGEFDLFLVKPMDQDVLETLLVMEGQRLDALSRR
jgi:CheY-like chemotaxis protein